MTPAQAALAAVGYVLERKRLSGSVVKNFLHFTSSVTNYDEARALLYGADDPALTATEKEWNEAIRVVEDQERAGIWMISLLDPKYPISLRAIFDPPVVLYLRGALDVLDELPGVAVVGTRKASLGGKEIARRIAQYLGREDWTIVSGLALGIDAAAHEGALEVNAKTIAVLAHGLEEPNPKANEGLAYRILEAGGAWISEHRVGVPPLPKHFVPRNRIQVGLSAGSIIVEGEIRSGSTTQAQFCIQAKRPLFAVVPESEDNPLDLVDGGTRYLVKEKGAIPLRTREDYPALVARLTESAAQFAPQIELDRRWSAKE